jgi:hypothetical protein
MHLKQAVLACALMLSAIGAANGNGGAVGAHGGFAAGGTAYSKRGWSGSPGWPRGATTVSRYSWRKGFWWHGGRGRRLGWWWIVGPAWFWYPAAIYPYPDFYTPPYLPPGYLYWCDFYMSYYPDIPDCPAGWQVVPPQ